MNIKVCTFVFGMLLSSIGAGSQAQEIPVPLSGSWEFDTVLSAKGFSNIARNEPLSLHVNACGDQIFVVHPDFTEASIILRFEDDGVYRGAGHYNSDQGPIPLTFALQPANKRLIRGRVEIKIPTWKDPMVLEPFVAKAKAGDEPENFGYGELRMGTRETETKGIFTVDTIDYQAILSEFNVGSYELLPLHKTTLDEASLLATSSPSGRNDRGDMKFCENQSTLGQVEGFADANGIERAKWQDYAMARATAVAWSFRGANIGDGRITINTEYDQPGAPGRGTSECKRAAVADLDIRYRWARSYSDKELERWLRNWFAAFGTDTQRVYAKEAFCLFHKARADIGAGSCPSRNSSGLDAVAYNALSGDVSSDQGIADMFRIYASFARTATSGDAISAVQSERDALEQEASANSFRCDPSVRSRADDIELEVFGDVVDFDQRTSSALKLQDWLNKKAEPITDFIDPKK